MKAKYVIEYWGKDQNTIESRLNSEPKTVKVYGWQIRKKAARLVSRGCTVLAVYDVSGYIPVPVC